MEAVASLVSCLAHGRATALLRLDSNPTPPVNPPRHMAGTCINASQRSSAVGARQPAVWCMLLSGCWRPPGHGYRGCAPPGWGQAEILCTIDAHALGCARWCAPRGCERLVRGARGSQLLGSCWHARTYYCDHVFMARLCDQIESSDQVKHCS